MSQFSGFTRNVLVRYAEKWRQFGYPAISNFDDIGSSFEASTILNSKLAAVDPDRLKAISCGSLFLQFLHARMPAPTASRSLCSVLRYAHLLDQ